MWSEALYEKLIWRFRSIFNECVNIKVEYDKVNNHFVVTCLKKVEYFIIISGLNDECVYSSNKWKGKVMTV